MVNDTTLPSDNPLKFRKNPLKQIYNKIMTTDEQIKDEKLQYDINWEGAKLSGSIKVYQKCTAVPYSFLVNDTTLPSDIPLKFRKNLLK